MSMGPLTPDALFDDLGVRRLPLPLELRPRRPWSSRSPVRLSATLA
jgi:hypothetical protein